MGLITLTVYTVTDKASKTVPAVKSVVQQATSINRSVVHGHVEKQDELRKDCHQDNIE